MVRCKYTLKIKKDYQAKCPKEAKKKGYCLRHYALRQKEKFSSESNLESPRPLTHISKGVSDQEKFSKKFGKKGKIKIKEKVKKNV